MITLTILFAVCAIVVFFKLLMFAIKASWGLVRLLTSFLIFPILLVLLVAKGLIIIAFPLLIIVGIKAFLATI